MTPRELRLAREVLGLSQVEMADRLGLDSVTVSRWERGVQSISQPAMVRLALERLLGEQRGGLLVWRRRLEAE